MRRRVPLADALEDDVVAALHADVGVGVADGRHAVQLGFRLVVEVVDSGVAADGLH